MAKAPKSEKLGQDEPLDLAPDAWERFEAAVDKVVKAPPAHDGKAGRIKDAHMVRRTTPESLARRSKGDAAPGG